MRKSSLIYKNLDERGKSKLNKYNFRCPKTYGKHKIYEPKMWGELHCNNSLFKIKGAICRTYWENF